MLPKHLKEFRPYPDVKRSVDEQLTMQFADLRALLLRPGSNFLAASALCNIVSGLSVTLCKPANTKKLLKMCGKTKSVP